ncbi:MAG: virulence RhuM family protein [Polaromonas sp.]|nr:virulence RhuM family protein [Polaromonas sp.]
MSELILYQTEDGLARVQLRAADGSAWLTQAEIAELFATTKQNVSLHAKNILEERELDEGATVKESLTVQTEGSRQVQRSTILYSLPMILAIGYRVKGPRGTQFRQWATAHLSDYLVKGFVMDDERLKNPPGPGQKDYFDELLERIRDIRSSERRFYQKVLDIYATSVDYAPDTELAQQFFATVQNKMHWATHGQTAAEVIHDRANAAQPFMGLQTTRPGGVVRKGDVAVAKNYLSSDELQVLNRIVNLYIEYAELQALERKPMLMQNWLTKLDEFLKITGRQLLDHAGQISAASAKAKAELEYANYRKQQDLQPRAVDADFERVAKQLKAIPKAKPVKRKKGKK